MANVREGGATVAMDNFDLESLSKNGLVLGFAAAVYAGIKWMAAVWQEGRRVKREQDSESRKTEEQREQEREQTVASVFRETLKGFQENAQRREEQVQIESKEREARHEEFRQETKAEMNALREKIEIMAHDLGEAKGQVKVLSSQHDTLFKNQEREIGTMAGTIAANVLNKSQKVKETVQDATQGGVDP